MTMTMSYPVDHTRKRCASYAGMELDGDDGNQQEDHRQRSQKRACYGLATTTPNNNAASQQSPLDTPSPFMSSRSKQQTQQHKRVRDDQVSQLVAGNNVHKQGRFHSLPTRNRSATDDNGNNEYKLKRITSPPSTSSDEYTMMTDDECTHLSKAQLVSSAFGKLLSTGGASAADQKEREQSRKMYTEAQLHKKLTEALARQEEQLREEYDRVLREQLQEQFNMFSKFNQDYVARSMTRSTAEYFS